MLPRIVRAAAGRRLLSTYPTAPERLSSLRAMIANPPGGDVVRVLEVHSGLCGLIAETARGPNGEAFDATWSSSLTSSAIKGKPDIETVDTSARIGQVEDVLEVSTKPMIYDGDTGGLPEIFHFTVRRQGAVSGGRRGVSLGIAWTPPSPHGSVTSFPKCAICFLAGCAILPM